MAGARMLINIVYSSMTKATASGAPKGYCHLGINVYTISHSVEPTDWIECAIRHMWDSTSKPM